MCAIYSINYFIRVRSHQKHYKHIVYEYGFNTFSNRCIPQVKCTACCFIKFLFIVQRDGFPTSPFSLPVSLLHLLFRLFKHQYKLVLVGESEGFPSSPEKEFSKIAFRHGSDSYTSMTNWISFILEECY